MSVVYSYIIFFTDTMLLLKRHAQYVNILCTYVPWCIYYRIIFVLRRDKTVYLSNGHHITLLPLDNQDEDWSWIVPYTMISSPSSNTPLYSFQTTKLSALYRFRDRQSALRAFLNYLHMIGSFVIQLCLIIIYLLLLHHN